MCVCIYVVCMHVMCLKTEYKLIIIKTYLRERTRMCACMRVRERGRDRESGRWHMRKAKMLSNMIKPICITGECAKQQKRQQRTTRERKRETYTRGVCGAVITARRLISFWHLGSTGERERGGERISLSISALSSERNILTTALHTDHFHYLEMEKEGGQYYTDYLLHVLSVCV